MSLLEKATYELQLIYGDDPDDINKIMVDGILDIVGTFAEQGHSGASAGYAISVITKLLKHKPLTQLTGLDDEWSDVNDGIHQNKRDYSVFKDSKSTYRIDGQGNREEIKFPYTSPKEDK